MHLQYVKEVHHRGPGYDVASEPTSRNTDLIRAVEQFE